MKSILDSSFVYTNSASTDLAKTFRRVRAQMKRNAAIKEPVKKVKQDKLRLLSGDK